MKIFALILWIINLLYLIVSVLSQIPGVVVYISFTIEPFYVYLSIATLIFLSAYLLSLILSKNKTKDEPQKEDSDDEWDGKVSYE